MEFNFLGIKQMYVSFVLAFTTPYSWNSWNTFNTSHLMISQPSYNAAIVNPSGPGAFSFHIDTIISWSIWQLAHYARHTTMSSKGYIYQYARLKTKEQIMDLGVARWPVAIPVRRIILQRFKVLESGVPVCIIVQYQYVRSADDQSYMTRTRLGRKIYFV